LRIGIPPIRTDSPQSGISRNIYINPWNSWPNAKDDSVRQLSSTFSM